MRKHDSGLKSLLPLNSLLDCNWIVILPQLGKVTVQTWDSVIARATDYTICLQIEFLLTGQLEVLTKVKKMRSRWLKISKETVLIVAKKQLLFYSRATAYQSEKQCWMWPKFWELFLFQSENMRWLFLRRTEFQRRRSRWRTRRPESWPPPPLPRHAK